MFGRANHSKGVDEKVAKMKVNPFAAAMAYRANKVNEDGDLARNTPSSR
jgi:hypothetical protein